MLRPTGVVVNDIVEDIGSGVVLCKLAMLLTMKKIRYQKNPRMVFQVRISGSVPAFFLMYD